MWVSNVLRNTVAIAAAALLLSRSSRAEPTLRQAVEAATRLAAGTLDEDESRLSRARAAHWAPQLRAQVGGNSGQRERTGQQTQAPLQWVEAAAATTWLVAATWDLSQLVYDRDENQLALSRVHLARRRQEVAEETARLYVERARHTRALSQSPADDAGPGSRVDSLLGILRHTAALDALTGGLYATELERAQRELDAGLEAETGARRERPAASLAAEATAAPSPAATASLPSPAPASSPARPSAHPRVRR